MSGLTKETLQEAINELENLKNIENRIAGYYLNPADVRTLKIFAITEPLDNWMLMSGLMIIESDLVVIGCPIPFDCNGKILPNG